MIESLWQDLRYGMRMLRKSPGFTTVALLSLAFGIGANTTIFTLIKAVLLQPLPLIQEPERLVYFPRSLSYPEYLDHRDQTEVFSELIAFDGATLSLDTGSQQEPVRAQLCSANYFSALWVTAARGRAFLPEEGSAADPRAVFVMSHGLWQRRFGGDPSVVGTSVALNGIPFTVIGIAPASFSGLEVITSPEIYVPLAMQSPRRDRAGAESAPETLANRNMQWLNVVGRLKTGVTVEQARAATSTLAQRITPPRPDQRNESRFELLPIRGGMDPRERPDMLPVAALLLGAVGLVLMTVCVNVATLLLARASLRQREIGIRLALGASRGRLLWQLFTESLVLALLAGAAGLLLSLWATDLLHAIRPPATSPFYLDLRLDRSVLGFTFLVSLVTGLLFGLAPALHASRADLIPILKNESARLGGRSRLRNFLVVAQVTLSLVLLAGAGLFVRSLERVNSVNPSFDATNGLIVPLNLNLQRFEKAQGETFYRQLMERVKRLPGVQRASLVGCLPLNPAESGAMGVRVNDIEASIGFSVADVDYFKTMGIPLLRGRDFSSTDGSGAPAVAIINETMARRHWLGQDPIGKRFHIGDRNSPMIEVVGVAKDGKYRSLGEASNPYIYLPLFQNYNSRMTLVVRTEGDPTNLINPVRSEIQELDRNLPLFGIRTLREHLSVALAPARFGATLLGAFGLLALMLAAVGIYGVTAYTVAQRTREIGIRIALGAERRDVLRLVVLRGFRLALAGVALGLLASFGVMRVLSGFLYGVSATDPVTFLAVAIVLLGVALLACYLPARRAVKVDPMVALRYE